MVVSAPAAVSRSTTRKSPVRISLPSGGIRIKHSELIAAITTSAGAFPASLPVFALNPGMAATFAWLSVIANLYEHYHFRKLRFRFEPCVGTAKDGFIALSCDTDPLDAAPDSLVKMSNTKAFVKASLWKAVTLDIPLNELNMFSKNRFTRHTAIANTDLKTYDLGNVFVAWGGAPADTLAGHLYVEYEIDLLTPQAVAGG